MNEIILGNFIARDELILFSRTEQVIDLLGRVNQFTPLVLFI